MERRLLIASLLTLLIWFGYAEYLRRTAPPVPARPAPDAATKPVPAPTDEAAQSRTAAAPSPSVSTPPEPSPVRGPERTFTVETPLYRAVFTSRGARLRRYDLKKYADRLGKGAQPVDLVHVTKDDPEGWPLGLNLIGEQSSTALENVDFEGARAGDTLRFTSSGPGGVAVTKTYTVDPTSYLLTLEVEARNLGDEEKRLGIGLTWTNPADPKHHDSRQEGHAGPVVLVGSSVERVDVEDLEEEQRFSGNLLWTGFETKYFLAAMIPDKPEQARSRIWKPSPKVVADELSFPPGSVPPGSATSRIFRVYLGPKLIPELKRAGAGLDESIDFGVFAVLARPLLWILNFFDGFVGNYGVAIILLTLLVRIAFYPLASKQFRSMKEMQRLQPLIAELKEKHGKDRERFNQEMMQLYRTHKVNPLGGCLPILVQIPVFIALYQALLNSIELRQAPFFAWIQDLSAPDHTYVTPILMTASMFAQQKMSPPMADPAQQKVMMFMPLIFGFMFLNFPSGLVLYWLVNNILSIAQQYWINRQHG